MREKSSGLILVDIYLSVTIDGSFEILITECHVTSFPGVEHVLHLLCPDLKGKLTCHMQEVKEACDDSKIRRLFVKLTVSKFVKQVLLPITANSQSSEFIYMDYTQSYRGPTQKLENSLTVQINRPKSSKDHLVFSAFVVLVAGFHKKFMNGCEIIPRNGFAKR